MIPFQWLIIHSISLLNLSKHNLYEHPNFCACLHLSFLPGLPRRLDNSKMSRFKEMFGDDESPNDEREELSSSPHQKDTVDVVVWLRETSEELKPRTRTKMETQYCWLGGSGQLDVDGIPSMLTPNPLRTQGILARVKQLESISLLAPLSITRTGKEKSSGNARSAVSLDELVFLSSIESLSNNTPCQARPHWWTSDYVSKLERVLIC
jgi:hypothetical protein